MAKPRKPSLLVIYDPKRASYKDRESIVERLKHAASASRDSAPAGAGSSSPKTFVGPIPSNYADLPKEERMVIAGKLATAMQKALLKKG